MFQAIADHPFVAIGLGAYFYGMISLCGASLCEVVAKYHFSKAAGKITEQAAERQAAKAS